MGKIFGGEKKIHQFYSLNTFAVFSQTHKMTAHARTSDH